MKTRFFLLNLFFALNVPVVLFAEDFFKNIVPAPAEIRIQNAEPVALKDLKINEFPVCRFDESYRIACRNGEIAITGCDAGIFYARQTLDQLKNVPAEFEIFDAPRFEWRGLHLDESRHFFGKNAVKRLLDLMARYKLNRFHWHLCDGPGWRIEIKAFPRLTSVGAWRIDKTGTAWNWRATEIPAEPRKDKTGLYGGFYTQADIKEIVAYARERHITIVPEIELPGHSFAALVAYPKLLACPTNNVPVDGLRGKDVVCAGSDSVFDFYKKVLDEIVELFPGSPIHIGADEVPKASWEACPRCRNRLKTENLKDYDALQSYFVRRVAKSLTDRKIPVFGWDEIMDGGLPQGVGVTVWREPELALKSARDCNAPTVLSPQHPCYFNFRNVKTKQGEPPAEDASNTLAEVFAFDPIPSALAGTPFAKNILGVQANLWTEHIQTQEHLDYQLLPRLLALAEIAWSPKRARRYEAFFAAVKEAQIPALKALGFKPREPCE